MNATAQPISQANPAKGCSHRVLIPFGALFVVVGLVLTWVFLVAPLVSVWQASRWPSTECRIVRSAAKEHSDSDGTTWSPDIEYEYTAGGQTHRSNRVQFFEGSTSGRRWIDSLCAEYPAGSVRSCFYNPRKTDEAVLKRGLSLMALIGLLPLLFVGAGGLMVWAGFRDPARHLTSPQPPVRATAMPDAMRRDAVRADSGEGTGAAGDDDEADRAEDDEDSDDQDVASDGWPWAAWEGPRKLNPETTLRSRVIGLAIIALFWNGIVAIVFWNVLGNGIFVIGMLFFAIFGLVGAGLLIGFLHRLLCLFNPVVEIALENGAVAAGGELVLAWETRGNTARLRELRIEAVVREKATYTRGTSTTTDIEELARLPALVTTDPQAMRFGSVTLRIPPAAIHSYDGARNEVEWTIEIRGRIPFWPDVSERFPFFVKPMGC